MQGQTHTGSTDRHTQRCDKSLVTALIEERDHTIELKRTEQEFPFQTFFTRQLTCEIAVLLRRFGKAVVEIRVAAATELERTDFKKVFNKDVMEACAVSVQFVWLHIIQHENIMCILRQPLVNHCNSQKAPFYASPQQSNALLTTIDRAWALHKYMFQILSDKESHNLSAYQVSQISCPVAPHH